MSKVKHAVKEDAQNPGLDARYQKHKRETEAEQEAYREAGVYKHMVQASTITQVALPRVLWHGLIDSFDGDMEKASAYLQLAIIARDDVQPALHNGVCGYPQHDRHTEDASCNAHIQINNDLWQELLANLNYSVPAAVSFIENSIITLIDGRKQNGQYREVEKGRRNR